jgi:hypothetical protein
MTIKVPGRVRISGPARQELLFPLQRAALELVGEAEDEED